MENIIRMAVLAGRTSAGRMPEDAIKATWRRLYAIPDLRAKLKDDEEELENIKQGNGIARFLKSGMCLTQEEIIKAATIDLEATIAATRHELEVLEKALTSIQDDPYYMAVAGKYFEQMTDNEIAEKISCGTKAAWANRRRLVQRVAVRLYGVEAVK